MCSIHLSAPNGKATGKIGHCCFPWRGGPSSRCGDSGSPCPASSLRHGPGPPRGPAGSPPRPCWSAGIHLLLTEISGPELHLLCDPVVGELTGKGHRCLFELLIRRCQTEYSTGCTGVSASVTRSRLHSPWPPNASPTRAARAFLQGPVAGAWARWPWTGGCGCCPRCAEQDTWAGAPRPPCGWEASTLCPVGTPPLRPGKGPAHLLKAVAGFALRESQWSRSLVIQAVRLATAG